MHISLPEKVENIISTIEANGFEAYAVGGCVRDSILGRIPDDWDITTSASPQQVKGLFRHTIDTGIQHGTVTVMLGREGFEVTTYRIDGEYEDSRHPKEVTFTSNLREDLTIMGAGILPLMLWHITTGQGWWMPLAGWRIWKGSLSGVWVSPRSVLRKTRCV